MVAADLSAAAHRMVQLFGQLGDHLTAEDAAGMLGTDDGTPSADVVTAARKRLAAASASATLLSAQLAALQNGIAGLNGRGPNREGRAA
jgi:hypothetical protein